MKKLLLIICLVNSYLTFSNDKKEVTLNDYWEIISVAKDTTIPPGQTKIKLIILDKYDQTPINAVKIFLNTDLLLGQSDTNGIVTTTFPFGNNKLCADTKEGNSFTTGYSFIEQHFYIVKIRMSKYVSINIEGNGLYEVADKPVIYLYPEKKQNINVKVIPKNDFLFTYPHYPNNGWDVTAYPNGKIDYKNKTYNYLFWEGTYPPIIEKAQETGFIVNSDTLIQFFENTLTTIGLNSFEQADFITYWGPKLMENQINYIHFYFNDTIDQYVAKLEITPTPKSLIRVFMTYHPVDEVEYITPQNIPNYIRVGFTAVEWGGSYH